RARRRHVCAHGGHLPLGIVFRRSSERRSRAERALGMPWRLPALSTSTSRATPGTLSPGEDTGKHYVERNPKWRHIVRTSTPELQLSEARKVRCTDGSMPGCSFCPSG